MIQSGKGVAHLETMRLTKSGARIEVLTAVTPICDRSGAVIAEAHLAWDISEVRRLQRQLAQAQKLESVGQLAAGIAHEINTPIQYIGDNAEFLARTFHDLSPFAARSAEIIQGLRRGPDPALADTLEQLRQSCDVDYLCEEAPKAIGQLAEGAQQVARIVRAMKEFSHPGAAEKVPLDINRAIQSTVVVSRNEWKYVAELTTDFDPALPPVPCLPGELNQTMLNLVVNAVHAIAEVVNGSTRKGEIQITTRRNGSWAEIRVRDTGTGIPEAIQSRVFDPFFTTKEVGKGTGQGLSIAYDVVVKKHGGTLSFETQVGAGTTFLVRLPLEASERK
jgi:signal transduction histidine kinase